MDVQMTFNIGGIKVLSMSTAATICIGESIVANRNNSKMNSGPSVIGDGSVRMPIQSQVTYDPDNYDTIEVSGHNRVIASQE